MAEIGTVVAEKVVGSLFVVAKTEIGYIWNCSDNVENFRREAKNLEVKRGQVQELIDIAVCKGDKLKYGVENWVKEADTAIYKAHEFLEKEADAKKPCCKIGLCGNWKTLHRYGKRATKMAPSLLHLLERGSAYESCVSVETLPPTQLDVYQTKNPEDLNTHNSALNAIIAALEGETKQIIGIHGSGGVGKTTLAKEVAARVKKTNMLFDDVAFATISQTVNAEKIKKDLENATKRIMNGDKILIILDDVWKKLNLDDICIPINHTNCKILMTSRNEDVFEKMNVQCKICVNSLPMDEAWILFKRVVGESVETDAHLKGVAEEVAKECGGLPLLIQAVGNALKNKGISSWKVALSRLKKGAPSEIDPDIREAFAHLKLSYDYLESEEVKSCFLLCSMFPEDDDISLDTLACYVLGLEKFDDIESMEDARDRVRNAVDVLTSSCLLLNTNKWGEGYTKMHDVVRDVALLIVSEGKNKYLVKAGKDLTEWQAKENNLKDYTGTSLMDNMISKLPDLEVHLSSLDIFLINNNIVLSMISDEFVKGMKEVKVLDLSGCCETRLPQSLKLLTKLRMLNLEGNVSFHDISLLKDMKELEILILNNTRIKEISEEIGQLVNLRRLEVGRCDDITPGVISALSRLEELCIDLRHMSEGLNGCIAEVIKLSKLAYLDLKVESFDLIPEGGFENLKGFVIQIGDFYTDEIT